MQDTQPYRRQRRLQATRLPRRVPPERKPVRRGRRARMVGMVLFALGVAAVVLVVQRAAAFNDAVSTASPLSVRLVGPFGEDRFNVLLLGYNDESHGGAFLSDSINVLSIDRGTDTTTMIPIPRDLWVEGMPEVPQNMKINEAFRIGYYDAGIENGAELSAAAVTHVTGLEIHGWISLDFDGFQAMVDAIGGISLENPTAFGYTWAEPDYLAGTFEHAFSAGTLELDGQQALDYARNRYTSVVEESSDFARLVRQQRVLQAIRAEITGWQALPRSLALADSLAGHLRTSLSVWDLAMLAGELDVDRRLELAVDVTLSATMNTIGQYVLVPIGQASSTDYSLLHEFFATSLASPSAEIAGD